MSKVPEYPSSRLWFRLTACFRWFHKAMTLRV